MWSISQEKSKKDSLARKDSFFDVDSDNALIDHIPNSIIRVRRPRKPCPVLGAPSVLSQLNSLLGAEYKSFKCSLAKKRPQQQHANADALVNHLRRSRVRDERAAPYRQTSDWAHNAADLYLSDVPAQEPALVIDKLQNDEAESRSTLLAAEAEAFASLGKRQQQDGQELVRKQGNSKQVLYSEATKRSTLSSKGNHAVVAVQGQPKDRQCMHTHSSHDSPPEIATHRMQSNITTFLHDAHSDWVMAMTSWGPWFVTCSMDKTARVWDENDAPKAELTGHTSGICCVLVHNDVLYTGSNDGTIRLWDSSMSFVGAFEGHADAVYGLTVWQSQITSCSKDGTIKMWDAQGAVTKTFNAAEPTPLYCLAVRDNMLYCGAYDGSISVYDKSGSLVQRMKGHEGVVFCLCVHGDLVLSGSGDKTIRVWDTNYAEKAQMLGHDGVVSAILVHEGVVFSASYDKSIRVWTMDGRLKKELVGHDGLVLSLAISRGRLISSSADNTLHVRNEECCRGLLKSATQPIPRLLVPRHIHSASSASSQVETTPAHSDREESSSSRLLAQQRALATQPSVTTDAAGRCTMLASEQGGLALPKGSCTVPSESPQAKDTPGISGRQQPSRSGLQRPRKVQQVVSSEAALLCMEEEALAGLQEFPRVLANYAAVLESSPPMNPPGESDDEQLPLPCLRTQQCASPPDQLIPSTGTVHYPLLRAERAALSSPQKPPGSVTSHTALLESPKSNDALHKAEFKLQSPQRGLATQQLVTTEATSRAALLAEEQVFAGLLKQCMGDGNTTDGQSRCTAARVSTLCNELQVVPPERMAQGPQDWVIAMGSWGPWFVTASFDDGTARVWDENDALKAELTGHTSGICCLLVHNDVLYTGSNDGTIRLWDSSMSFVGAFEGHADAVYGLTVWQSQITSCSKDGTIKMWDAQGAVTKTLRARKNIPVYCLAVRDNMLYCGAYDGSISVYDKSGSLVQRMKGHEGVVFCLCVHGDLVLSGSGDKTIRVWDTNYAEKAQMLGHDGVVSAILVHEGVVFSASYDKSIRVWTMDGRLKKELVGHDGLVLSLAISRGRLISSSADNTLHVWNEDEVRRSSALPRP